MNKLQKNNSSKYLFNFQNKITTTCLLFTAEWCDACKDIEQLFDDKNLQYNSTINFKKINVDDENIEHTTIQYKIIKIPTLILIENGKIIKYINDKITEETFDQEILSLCNNVELETIVTNK